MAGGVQGNVTLAFKPHSDNAQPKSNDVEDEEEANQSNRADSSDEQASPIRANATMQVDVTQPDPAALKDEDRAANGRALLQVCQSIMSNRLYFVMIKETARSSAPKG
jgi:hypothetical protein